MDAEEAVDTRDEALEDLCTFDGRALADDNRLDVGSLSSIGTAGLAIGFPAEDAILVATVAAAKLVFSSSDSGIACISRHFGDDIMPFVLAPQCEQ